MKKIFTVLVISLCSGIFYASPLEEIKLKKGMKREVAEKLIADALGQKSAYNIYSMNREKEGKCNDGKTLLIVTY